MTQPTLADWLNGAPDAPVAPPPPATGDYAADAAAAVVAYTANARTKARRRCARLVAARIPWSAVEAGLRGAA